MSGSLFHYTDGDGFNGIRAASPWVFRASNPPGDHPRGAYFTDYHERTALLAQKLRVPRSKLGFVFVFLDSGDLQPLPGGRGQHIFYSSVDYPVAEPRQVRHGATGL
jgi:hypothetical protein